MWANVLICEMEDENGSRTGNQTRIETEDECEIWNVSQTRIETGT